MVLMFMLYHSLCYKKVLVVDFWKGFDFQFYMLSSWFGPLSEALWLVLLIHMVANKDTLRCLLIYHSDARDF